MRDPADQLIEARNQAVAVTEIGTVHALEIGEDGAGRYGWID
jgi:hypothetical protein